MRKKTAIAVFGLWGAGVLALLLVLGGIDLVAPPVHAQWNSTLTGRGNTGDPAIAEYCTPAVQASDVSGTASVVNALNATASCTVPAACAAGCRAAISWNVRVQAAANTGIEIWVTDGTNNFTSVHTTGKPPMYRRRAGDRGHARGIHHRHHHVYARDRGIPAPAIRWKRRPRWDRAPIRACR